MKKTAFLLLSLALPFAACQSTNDCGPDCASDCCEAPAEALKGGDMKTVAPGTAESMVMTTFEFKKANP